MNGAGNSKKPVSGNTGDFETAAQPVLPPMMLEDARASVAPELLGVYVCLFLL